MSKSNHVILLGAGASQPAGVPTAIPMVDRMEEVMARRNAPPAVQAAYRFVVSTLRNEVKDKPREVDIEGVYQAVELISKRQSAVTKPFVKDWRPEILQFEKQNEGVFDFLTDIMRQSLVDLTYIEDPLLVRYYEPLVEAASNSGTPIFTLNYDNAVELACESKNLTIDFGLSEWQQVATVSFQDSALNLAKIHGSVTWASLTNEHYGPQLFFDFKNPQPLLPELKSGELLPYVIFGNQHKLNAEAFMLDYLAEFARRLRPDSTLHIVGYGFGDAHINHVIARWRKQGGLAIIYDYKDEAAFRHELLLKVGATSIAAYSSEIPDLIVHGDTSAVLTLSELIPEAIEAV